MVVVASGCTISNQRSAPSRYSLVGNWAFTDAITAGTPFDPIECGTDFGARYSADGSYSGYEEAGRWSVQGDILTETVTREMGKDGELVDVIAKTSRARLRWISARQINVDFDGDIGGMIRCTD